MPQGLERFQQAESLHFITFSCYHRLPYLAADAVKSSLEATLEDTRRRHGARIYAYVMMPEHVHFLVNEPKSILLGQFIKAFKQVTSRRLRDDRPHFWQTRYYDRNVRDNRTEVIRYIHRNPVKRGLVTDPADYPWSSFLHYATGEPRTVEIESDWTAARRDRAAMALTNIHQHPHHR